MVHVPSFRPPPSCRSAVASVLVALCCGACSTHHWAQVETSDLPLPPGPKVQHTDRLVILIEPKTHETQCVVAPSMHPMCYHDLRRALAKGLSQSLWPVFPDVHLARERTVRPEDYVLQIEVLLDALPPDSSGPGWSAGARSRYRLLRGGEVLLEETLASRSRSHFPYGAPLGEGATEVIDATVIAIAQAVSAVPEKRPRAPIPLPPIATRTIVSPTGPTTAARPQPEITAASDPDDDSQTEIARAPNTDDPGTKLLPRLTGQPDSEEAPRAAKTIATDSDSSGP